MYLCKVLVGGVGGSPVHLLVLMSLLRLWCVVTDVCATRFSRVRLVVLAVCVGVCFVILMLGF